MWFRIRTRDSPQQDPVKSWQTWQNLVQLGKLQGWRDSEMLIFLSRCQISCNVNKVLQSKIVWRWVEDCGEALNMEKRLVGVCHIGQKIFQHEFSPEELGWGKAGKTDDFKWVSWHKNPKFFRLHWQHLRRQVLRTAGKSLFCIHCFVGTLEPYLIQNWVEESKSSDTETI